MEFFFKIPLAKTINRRPTENLIGSYCNIFCYKHLFENDRCVGCSNTKMKNFGFLFDSALICCNFE